MALTADLLNATREQWLDDMSVELFLNKHPLLDLMWKNRKTYDGGKTLDFVVATGGPGALQWYADRTIPAATENNVLETAQLPWRKAIYTMVMDGDVSIINKSDSAIINIAQQYMKFGMEHIAQRLDYALFNADGTGNNPAGLPAIFANNYAGLTDAGVPLWAPVRVDAASTTLSQSLIESAVTQVQEKMGKPSILVVSRANRMILSRLIDNKTTYETPGAKGSLELGTPPKLYAYGLEVMINSNCPNDTAYVLDPSGFRLGVSSDPKRTLSISEWKYQLDRAAASQATREDSYSADALFAGNFICENRHHQAAITNLVLA